MTDTELHEERKPALVAGVIIGALIAVGFAALFAWLGGVSVGSAAVVATMVLLVGWAALMAVTYGPAPTEAD